MPTEVTDPNLLAQLNGPQEVTDPHVLAQLNGGDESPPETAGRVAGLAGRAAIKGAGDLAGLIPAAAGAIGSLGDPGGAMINRAQQDAAGPYKPQLSDFVHPEKWQQAAEYFSEKAANKVDLPNPSTPAERIGSRALEALPSAILAPEARIAGGISAAMGSGASQAVKEGGGSPVAQTLAGLGAGSIGAVGAAGAAGLRGIVRGGEAGRAAMEQTMDTAGQTPLSLGQAAGNTPLQYFEGGLRKLPGSGPLKKLPGQQAASLGSRVEDIVDNLSGGSDVSPTGAGNAITKGTAGTLASMRNQEATAYGKLDALIPADAPIDVSGTLGKLDALAKPTPGAEASTGSLVSGKISKLRDNLTADMAANAAKNAPPAHVNNTLAPQPDAMAEAVASEKQGSTLPYSAVRALRTAVGNNVDWGFAPSDPVTNGGLKQVWGQLTDDLNNGASGISTAARQASDAARTLYAKNQETREFLDNIVDQNGGPESVFKAATNGTKDGATKIGGVMNALQPPQQNLVRATVLDKLGRASGAQDAEFNPSTFLTNWTKLDPSAKDSLFGQSGPSGSLRSNLDSLTKTMGTIRSGTKLQNWSGSGEAVGHSASIIAGFEGLRELVATGNPHMLAGTAAGITANHVMSRILTSPKVLDWFTKTTKLPTSAIPNAINQLSQVQDPDAQAVSQYLAQGDRIQRASGGSVGVDALVERLMKRWHAAKRDGDAGTKQLLKVPDEAIARALKIAEKHI